MKTIYKYEFEIQDYFSIEMPHGAKILKVDAQSLTPCIWAEVDTDSPRDFRQFQVYGTGHEIKDSDLIYIGTFQMASCVWHLYERKVNP